MEKVLKTVLVEKSDHVNRTTLVSESLVMTLLPDYDVFQSEWDFAKRQNGRTLTSKQGTEPNKIM